MIWLSRYEADSILNNSMNKKKHNTKKDILFILISSFIIVAAWIGFNLYHIWVTSTVSQNIQMQLTPIDPNFDPATIQQLRSREHIDPSYEQRATPSQVVSTTPTAAQAASDSSRFVPTTEPINRQGQ